MPRINELQKSYVKHIIKAILVLKPLTIDQVVRLTCQKAMPNVTPTREEKELIEQLTGELAFEGELNIANKKIELNLRYRVASVEEDYKLEDEGASTRQPINIDGEYEVETVGSERYPYIWKALDEGLTVEVELIPEPTNTRDHLAVAVCIDSKPYAYFPRPDAAKYHELIEHARDNHLKIVTNAKVFRSEGLLKHKYFILHLQTEEQFKTKLGKG